MTDHRTTMRAPVTPKLEHVDTERVRREHEAKIVEIQNSLAMGFRLIQNVTLQDGIRTPIAHSLGRAARWFAWGAIRGLPARISSSSTAVGVTTLTDSGQAMTTNAYAGGRITDHSGQIYPILSNTATVFGVSNNSATPTAGAYVAIPPIGQIVEFRDGTVDSTKFLLLGAMGWGVTITLDLVVL